MTEKLRMLLVRIGAGLTLVVAAAQGALDTHLPAITAAIEANPNTAIAAIAGYFLTLHLSRQNK